MAKKTTTLKRKILAIHKPTPKGKKVTLPSGKEIGGVGRGDRKKGYQMGHYCHEDGSDAITGPKGGRTWFCSCPSFKYRKGRFAAQGLCKHLVAYFQMRKSGQQSPLILEIEPIVA